MSKLKYATIGAAILSIAGIVPAMAQDACVRMHRIYSTEVVDNHTLLVTDRARNEYTVHMNGICNGMTNVASVLVFHNNHVLGCIRPGDRISYNIPGGPGGLNCWVNNVTSGAPAADAPAEG